MGAYGIPILGGMGGRRGSAMALLILPTPLVRRHRSGDPLEFLDETYPTKTRGMGLPYGENFIILASTFFYDTPDWERDGQTDGLAIANIALSICCRALKKHNSCREASCDRTFRPFRNKVRLLPNGRTLQSRAWNQLIDHVSEYEADTCHFSVGHTRHIAHQYYDWPSLQITRSLAARRRKQRYKLETCLQSASRNALAVTTPHSKLREQCVYEGFRLFAYKKSWTWTWLQRTTLRFRFDLACQQRSCNVPQISRTRVCHSHTQWRSF